MLLKLPTGKSLEGWDKGSPGQELVCAWQDVFPVSVLDSNTTIPWSLVDNCLIKAITLFAKYGNVYIINNEELFHSFSRIQPIIFGFATLHLPFT